MAESYARLHHLHPSVQEPVPFYVIGTTSALKQEVEQSSLQRSKMRYISTDQLGVLPEEDQMHLFADADALLVEWQPTTASMLHRLRHALAPQHVPLLAVCGSDETDHVAALVIGADDIIERPLNPVVIKAKLRAFRRLHNSRSAKRPVPPMPSGKHVICLNPLLIDKRMRSFYIQQDLIELTRTEFDLMLFLMEHAGECASRDDILDAVWDMTYTPSTNILDVHIYSLRNKLKAYELSHMLKTVRGVGYRLAPFEEE